MKILRYENFKLKNQIEKFRFSLRIKNMLECKDEKCMFKNPISMYEMFLIIEDITNGLLISQMVK